MTQPKFRKSCPVCGTEFDAHSQGGNRRRKFCSRECFRLHAQLEAGARFGRLICLKFDHYDPKTSNAWYLFACDCGNQKLIEGRPVTGGIVKSCGCLWKEGLQTYAVTHGMAASPEYRAYMRARSRVRSKVPGTWRNYGGRGIEFRFKSFEEFFNAVGPMPTPKHSLDRIDNDGHYEPGNVKWATRREQSLNRVHCGKCRELQTENARLKRELAKVQQKAATEPP